jgi:peptidoglycan/xylan/chitin deacetylase (PgdA/CDA1 family)
VARWGPARKRAAVSVTFDHLGEAAAIEQGRWPTGEPIGRHFSVTEVLPRLLDLLGSVGVQASFFVEGWNADVYPGALRGLVAAGHEVGYHGWRHESWRRLTDQQAAEILDRGCQVFGALGIRLAGVRPPGGAQPPRTFDLLRKHGFQYVSLPGFAPTVFEGLASLPYQWEDIDAFYYSPNLRGLREARGLGPDPLPPGRLEAALGHALDRGGYLTLLFHTHMLDEEPRFAVFQRVLERVVSSAEVWCAAQRELAAWMLSHADEYPTGLALDTRSWG